MTILPDPCYLRGNAVIPSLILSSRFQQVGQAGATWERREVGGGEREIEIEKGICDQVSVPHTPVHVCHPGLVMSLVPCPLSPAAVRRLESPLHRNDLR